MKKEYLISLITVFIITLLFSGKSVQAVEICGSTEKLDVDGKTYVVQNNIWGASTAQCVNVDGTSFEVTKSEHNMPTNDAPASYPCIFRGCHWGDCTNNSGMPIAVGEIESVPSSWSISTPGSGAWNAAYDIWFHTSSSTSGQPDAAEIMIWINSMGGVQPAGSIIANNVSIEGANWDVWFYTGFGWNYIAYERTSVTTSVDFDLNGFFKDAKSRGYLENQWYLLDVEAGFEIWQGGVGLKTKSFSCTIGGEVPDENKSPTDISLSSSSVSEGEPSGTIVGTFSTTDPDEGDTHTYTLVSGSGSDDNSSFKIDGSSLKTNEVFDYSEKSSYSIRVKTDDGRGGTFEKQFTIKIYEYGSGCTCLNGTCPGTYYPGTIDDFSGEACYVSTDMGSSFNFWNIDEVNINGEDFSGYTSSDQYPPKIDGKYYIYLRSDGSGHFEHSGAVGISLKQDDPLLKNSDNHISGSIKSACKGYVKFILPSSQYISLDILDTRGIKVATPFKGFFSKGSHVITFPTNSLGQGVYIVAINCKKNKKIRKFLRVD